jgi:hypothetical protein
MPRIDQNIIRQRQGSNVRALYKGGKPLLKVSYKDKVAKNFEHTKDVIDYFIESTWFQDQSNLTTGGHRDLYLLYDAYNNKLPESQFNFVTNPLNSTRKEHTNFPARMRPYSIIRPNVDLLLGEFDKRPFNYTVIAHNADARNKMEEAIYQEVLKSLEQMFINAMNEIGAVTDVPSQEVELPADIQAKKSSNYKDQRAVMGQAALQRIEQDCNLKLEWGRMFKDWVIAGECYSFKNIRRGRFEYERVSSIDIDYDKGPDEVFVEDGGWVVRRRYMTAMDIVSLFYDELKPKDIDEIERTESAVPFTSMYFKSLFGNAYSSEEDLRRNKIPVFHVTFKYYTRIGILSYTDSFGQAQQMEVPEGYTARAGETIEWIWAPEWWEAHRVDLGVGGDDSGRGSLYLSVGPMLNQRSAINDFGECKGPYNGMRFSDTHSRNISLVELGLPYEVMYRILHYRLEHTIGKSKGKIALIDKNTIPKGNGWDEEKFFYYAEAMGFGLIDRNQIGTDKSWNQYQVLDLGLYEHITNLINVMQFIREEWDDLVGITRQRKGQIAASETATGVNTATYNSSVISERMFTMFDEFRKKELQGLLDISKFSDIAEGGSIHHMDDMKQIFTAIEPDDYQNSELGVYVSNSSKDIEELTTLKSLLPQMASQNMTPGAMLEMVQSRNISALKDTLHEMEAREMKAAEQSQANEQEMESRKLEIEKEYKAIEHEFASALQAEKYDREERIAHIKGQYALEDTNTPGDSLDPVAAQTLAVKAGEVQTKADIEAKKISVKEKEIEAKERTEKYKADKTLDVAKENKNQYDKKN